jgi:hypothetical protein
MSCLVHVLLTAAVSQEVRQRDVMRKKQMQTRLAEIARLDVGMNKDKEQVTGCANHHLV